jgi:hypothetical protein
MSIDEQIKRNRDRFTRKLEDVRADQDLTAEARARRIEPIYREAKATDARLRGERLEGLREKVRTAEREAFRAPPMRNADPALVQLNYRNALDAVEGIVDPSLLARRLDRALLTEDKALAKAVAWRANELGVDAVVRKFMDTDEAASRKWSDWAEAFSEVEQVERLGETLALGDAPIQEPDELRGQGHAQAASFG